MIHSVVSGTSVTKYLCTVKMAGPRDVSLDRFFRGQDDNDAVAKGIGWAQVLLKQSSAAMKIVGLKIIRFVMGGKTDTLGGTICFHWKSDAATVSLEEELDKAVRALLALELLGLQMRLALLRNDDRPMPCARRCPPCDGPDAIPLPPS